MKIFYISVLVVFLASLIIGISCGPRNHSESAISGRRRHTKNASHNRQQIKPGTGKVVASKNFDNYEIVVYEYEDQSSGETEEKGNSKVRQRSGSNRRTPVTSDNKLPGILPQLRELIQSKFRLKHFGKSSEEYYDYYDYGNGLDSLSNKRDSSVSNNATTSRITANEISGLESTENICLTSECTLAAAELLRSLDTTVHPCQDFYKFACGGWVKRHPIPARKASWNQVFLVEEKLDRQIKNILDAAIDPHDPVPLQQAKQFYKSCKNHVEKGDAREDLKRLGDQYLNDFQNVVKENKLANKLGKIRRELGGDFIVGIRVAIDEKNTTNYVIYLDQPDFSFNRHFLLSNPGANILSYKDLIQKLWPLVYPNKNVSQARLSDVAAEIVAFEILLANISSSPAQRANRLHLYNPFTLENFTRAFPDTVEVFNLTDYIQEVFKEVTDSGFDFGDISKLRIIVRDPLYFKRLGKMLRFIEDNKSSVIENYLRWRIITEYGAAMSRKFRDVVYKYSNIFENILDSATAPLRIKTCGEITNSYFGMAVSFKYVQQEFGVDFKPQIRDMVSNLMKSFEGILNETDWIATEETRAQALLKAQKMKPFLGFPDWLSNATALNEHYGGLTFANPDNVFENYLQVTRWLNAKALSNIGSKKDEDRWVVDPSITNAFYYHTNNALIFPAGILKPPFYYTGNQIQALNYGALGVVMGHEITHGFDYTGKDRDESGNLRNWWDKTTLKNYLDRTVCFIKQYSDYVVPELSFGLRQIHLNGRDTLDENIADNGGLRQSFKAYQSYLKKNGPEKQLPGLNYTSEQLFFLSFAHIWCGDYSSEGLQAQVHSDHSPHHFRVKGVLDNSPEFSETWNCPRPPKNSCRLW